MTEYADLPMGHTFTGTTEDLRAGDYSDAAVNASKVVTVTLAPEPQCSRPSGIHDYKARITCTGCGYERKA